VMVVAQRTAAGARPPAAWSHLTQSHARSTTPSTVLMLRMGFIILLLRFIWTGRRELLFRPVSLIAEGALTEEGRHHSQPETVFLERPIHS
jgi:hypothetical protein